MSLAPRALRPSVIAPRLRAVRGHAAAVDPPTFPRPSHSEGAVRHDWSRPEIQKIYDGALMETIFRAVGYLFLLYRKYS